MSAMRKHSRDENADAVVLPAVITYTHSLLEGSNTFIKSHAEAMLQHRPIYVGAHRVNGIPLPEERTYVVNDGGPAGRLKEAAFRRLGWAPGIVARLREQKPGIVHAHFGTSGPAAMVLARELRVPLVVTFHGQDATLADSQARRTFRGRELLRKKRQLVEQAGVIIAVSSYIRRKLLEKGYPERKVILHRNGIDTQFFRPGPFSARKPIVLFVGRFVEKKGARYLVEAAGKLLGQGVNFDLVLIGNGPLEGDLRAAVGEMGIRCQFMGFLPVEAVRGWLERASVVVVPSVVASDGDSEGLPTILLEAQAMATPVVATRHSGIPEGLKAGVTAELVEERDSCGLARAIRSFLESPEKIEHFGHAGRRFVVDEFDLISQVNGLEEIYADIRARHAASE